jgi:release factor glutamine methyltransferase
VAAPKPAAQSALTIGGLLDELAAVLSGPTVPPDRGGARDLIAALLGKPRFWPSANRAVTIDDARVARARGAAAALREGMPFAYAVGTGAFRHLTLQVDRRVLIPRPETELLVDLALAATGGRGTIADLCTGSGAVALALAAEGNYDRVIATDISPDALAVARGNLAAIPEDRRGVVDFRLGDLTAPLGADKVTALVSNPPYIAAAERAELPPSVRDWEPELALISGDDGMQAIARIISGAADVVLPGGFLVIEIDLRRSARAQALAATDGRWSDVQLRPDLTGRERFLAARRLPPR